MLSPSGAYLRRWSALLACAAALMLAAPDQVQAQPTTSAVAVPAVAVPAAPEIAVSTRTARAFKPFPQLDPVTQRPLKDDDTLTLPNGKKVNAGDYFKELNALEQWFNSQGHSLRDPVRSVGLLKLKPSPSVPGEMRTLKSKATLPDMTRAPRFGAAAISGPKPLTVEPRALSNRIARKSERNAISSEINANSLLSGRLLDGVAVDLAPVQVLCAKYPQLCRTAESPCEDVARDKSWGPYSVGNPSSLAADVYARLSLSGKACKPADVNEPLKSLSNFKLAANGGGSATLFSHKFNVVDVATAFENSASAGTISANVKVDVLGQTVFTFTDTKTAEFSYQNSLSYGVDFPVKFNFPLGPVSIAATVGGRGTASLAYDVFVSPVLANGSASPKLDTEAYAQVAVSVYIAEAGVGVDMTLADWDLVLSGKVGLGFNGTDFVLFDEAYAATTLDLLNGELYVYLKVYYPCWTGICSKTYTTTLWDWNGFQLSSVLFDEKNTHPLTWL